MSEAEIKVGARINDGLYVYIVTTLEVTTDKATGMPVSLWVEALSVTEVERREAEYAAMLDPKP